MKKLKKPNIAHSFICYNKTTRQQTWETHESNKKYLLIVICANDSAA